ncbi:MAG: hypothetical protein GF368_00300 [Candidatus Aenigmarchaeota archaeon]|nr:hypothetical protein [Candidatus Aenigmarchaeota archaeon]
MSIRVEMDQALEREFREKAMKVYGYSKGSLKKAVESAVKQWNESFETMSPKEKVDNPVDLIDGILSQLKGKMSSVELQNEATKTWVKEVD